MRQKLFSLLFLGLIILLQSCTSYKCENPNQKKYLTLEYEILEGSDCGWTGMLKDGEFYLEVNGTLHDSILIFPMTISKQKQIIKTNYDFNGNEENLRIRILDKNILMSLLDVVKDNLRGYYKIFGEVYEILKETSFLKKFMDNFVECGAENVLVNSRLAGNTNTKQIVIKDISGKAKVRLKLYYLCR